MSPLFRLLIGIWCCISLDPAWALTGAQELVLFNGSSHLPGATVDLNFAAGKYYTNGATGPLTVSRASSKTCSDLSGNWKTVAANVACITNQGVLIEESRTNSVLQNQFQGLVPGVIGSGGSLGTGWSIYNSGAGVVITVVGSGFEGGIPYADVSLVGSESPSGQNIAIYRSAATEVPAIYGNVITTSWFIKLQSGSNTNILGQGVRINQLNSGGSYLDGNGNGVTPSTTNLGLDRISYSYTVSLPSAAYAQPGYIWFLTASAINATYRIALPQSELNPNIPATVASAVTAASGTGGVNGSGVYTVTGGTCATPPTLNTTWAAGVLTVNSVANAGSCSVLPPSPATLAYASGTATGWTSATVTLTPTDNSAQGFATSPILTSGSAATRAADLISIPVTSGKSLYASGIPTAPITNSTVQIIAQIDDGTNNNKIQLARNSGNAAAFGSLSVGGTSVNPTPVGGTWAQNAPGKISGFLSGIAGQVSFNAGTPASNALAGTISATRLLIGAGPSTYGAWNGYISRVAVSPSSLLPY